MATTSRSASAIWRALSLRARKVEIPFTASTSVVTPESARRDERAWLGEERMQDGRGLGKSRRLENNPAEPREHARFPAQKDVAKRLDEIVAERTADAAAADQDGVAVQPLVKQMVEPDLAPFVDDHQRVGERRAAQEAVDQRGLARAEKAGDDVKADRVLAAHD